MTMKDLQDYTALVTGGTAGIGLETARLLADRGAKVTITGRDAEKGRTAITSLGDARGVRFIAADLADLSSVDELASQVGAVDIIVNNAGAFPTATTLQQNVDSFEKVFNTNVRGAYFLVAKLVPHMLAKGRGSIVNVSSIATAKGVAESSVYSASKSALESLTRTWAVEFGPHVRVNTVAPGPTRTEGVLVEWGDRVEDLGQGTALGRTADPAEIAEVIAFLAAPAASYVTGATVRADAGGAII
jgi:NAD(P)-dependent dehydrogenase (short-subunit alcohol dehydrogenase family)